jgi:hypothetical protein
VYENENDHTGHGKSRAGSNVDSGIALKMELCKTPRIPTPAGVDQIEKITELTRLITPPIVEIGIENLRNNRPTIQVIQNKRHRFDVDNAATPKTKRMYD